VAAAAVGDARHGRDGLGDGRCGLKQNKG